MQRTALLIAAIVSAWPAAALAQHKVLMIVVDDVGVENIGAYGIGTAPPPTPNIDRLAQRGILFRNAWSNPLCSPSRACIQTGRYSFRTGVGTSTIGLGPVLADDETTLPELFPEIPSAAFGKWHLGAWNDQTAPNRQGYRQFQGEIFGILPTYYAWPYTQNGVTGGMRNYATSTNVDDAIAWIGQQTGDWFVYLGLNAPHLPYHNPPPELHSYSLTRETRTASLQFKAAIEAADTEIGRLLAAVDLREATVIVVSDNGTASSVAEEPFGPDRAKGTVYEGGVSVPLIIAGHGVTAGGRQVLSIVQLTDLFATVAELMGASATTGTDSVSLLPYLENPLAKPLRSTMYCEMFGSPFPNGRDAARAMRNQRYKLLQIAAGTSKTIVEEFYDLTVDPYEHRNLIGDPAHAEVITQLRIQMEELAGPWLP